MAEDNSISALRALSNGTRVPQTASNDGIQTVRMITAAPGTDADCVVPAPTISNNIDTKNLYQQQGDVIQFDVTNGAAIPLTLILGLGVLGQTGIPALYGIGNAAVDDPLAVDGGGASVGHMQLFSHMTNGHAWLASEISVFGASAAQISQQIRPTKINPNLNIFTSTGNLTKIDTDLNYATLSGCTTPLSFYQGALYTLGAGETVSLQIKVAGVATIENFSTGLGN